MSSPALHVGDTQPWHRPHEAKINEMSLSHPPLFLFGQGTEAQRVEVTCLRTCRHKWQGQDSNPGMFVPPPTIHSQVLPSPEFRVSHPGH